MNNLSQSLPSVSLIIPIRNEARYILKSVQSALSQDYPAERIEIIVVDGMSDDNTDAILAQIQQTVPGLLILKNPCKIVPCGMNIALPKARGEIIIRIDGHCEVAADYVSRCVSHILKDQVQGVGGPMTTIGESPLSETIAVAMSSQFGVGNSAFRTTTGQTRLVDTVAFPAYTRKIIDEVGLYDEELVRNQDDEYNYRIREAGGKILLAADVRSKYYSRGSLQKLWKQYYQYGFYKVRVLQKHLRQMSLRQFVPPTFVLSLLVSALLSVLFPWGWVSMALVAGSYLLANLTASIYTAARKGWQHLSLLPLIFAILHFSYGLGILAGLVHFRNRWGDKKGKVPALDLAA